MWTSTVTTWPSTPISVALVTEPSTATSRLPAAGAPRQRKRGRRRGRRGGAPGESIAAPVPTGTKLPGECDGDRGAPRAAALAGGRRGGDYRLQACRGTWRASSHPSEAAASTRGGRTST